MYMSVSEAAVKFNISKRRVQTLCEQGRIVGVNMVNGIWLIPTGAEKPLDARKRNVVSGTQLSLLDYFEEVNNEDISIDEVCDILSISKATAKNWIKLGKIQTESDGKSFNKIYIEKLAKAIKSGKDGRLKSRRNKKNVSGKVLYKDYIKNDVNRTVVENILSTCDCVSEDELRIILVYFAIQLFCQSNNTDFYDNPLVIKNSNFTGCSIFNELLSDLLGTINLEEIDLSNISWIFNSKVQFVPTEDTLGFVYISLRDLSRRKQTGAYYTPEKNVNALIDDLFYYIDVDNATFCDPCCGTGNFLIGLLNRGVNADNVYGQDIDEISVMITRINMYLLNNLLTKDELYSHFVIGNTLENTFVKKFSVILGNPPWGYNYSKDEKAYLLSTYRTAKIKGMESYDLFIERGLDLLQDNGYMAYILPEALLSVSSHLQARKIILKETSFSFVNYLGNAFSGVQCPSIILGLKKDGQSSLLNCRVKSDDTTFTIRKERSFGATSFSFNMNDDEYACLEAISRVKSARYLANNAKFALGIVTGNNKEYIKTSYADGCEIVLKGCDILRYSTKETNNYIKFEPKLFQQVAPTELYRAEEKLLYRFISEVPVFTYDNKQMLSLNSCNILIPQINGMNIKYILAVLNSSVAAFYFKKKFNSVKLLRSHIESLPIPEVDFVTQSKIIEKVDRIMNSTENISGLYAELDNDIMMAFSLTINQMRTIQSALQGKNLFLSSE